jgi:hypothetical protein
MALADVALHAVLAGHNTMLHRRPGVSPLHARISLVISRSSPVLITMLATDSWTDGSHVKTDVITVCTRSCETTGVPSAVSPMNPLKRRHNSLFCDAIREIIRLTTALLDQMDLVRKGTAPQHTRPHLDDSGDS